jgi:hypothetical protein
MRSHILTRPATTKYFSNSFAFKTKIEKKDFPEVIRLTWAQEVWSSNLHAPTIYFFIFNSLLLMPVAAEPDLGSIWVQIQASRRTLLRDAALPGSRANKSRA